MNCRLAPKELKKVYVLNSMKKDYNSDELFMKMFNTGTSMMSIKTFSGRIVNVNDSWLLNTGYSREEVIGKNERDINIWLNDSIVERLKTIFCPDV
ncbi:MAG: hypothetical protein APF84_18130 [Gracilibacter sp. BRH_c7a]|nr:MAG: hypothetical protein APF84_18130 [Gracilibacter sp. BRH_c7a]